MHALIIPDISLQTQIPRHRVVEHTAQHGHVHIPENHMTNQSNDKQPMIDMPQTSTNMYCCACHC